MSLSSRSKKKENEEKALRKYSLSAVFQKETKKNDSKNVFFPSYKCSAYLLKI